MNSPITNANYEESVQTLKEKFEQVMGVGVRQIAVLADDAANQGNDLYIKLMEELVDWVSSEEMQNKYPGEARKSFHSVRFNTWGMEKRGCRICRTRCRLL